MFVEKTERGLRERGHEVKIFSPVSIPSMPFWGYPGERLVIPLGFSMLNVHKFKPDVIHTHTPFGVGWEAIYAATILGVPVVGTHHTFYDHYLKHVYLDFDISKKMSWTYTVTYYNRCDFVTCPSSALAKSLSENGLYKPVEVVHNCVDTDIFVPTVRGNRKPSLVYMGRLSYEKSIDVVIKAFKIILDKLPDLRLSIVGDGPERASLEKLTVLLGIESKVNFLGVKRGADLVRALQDNDIFLTASASENMPLSIIEAMATGLPVIGVNALGIPEIVRNGENGFLVQPNSPDEMAKVTLKLLGDKVLLEKLGKGANSSAQNYSRGKVAEKLETLYTKLINFKK